MKEKNNKVTQETILPTNLYTEEIVNVNDSDGSNDIDDSDNE